MTITTTRSHKAKPCCGREPVLRRYGQKVAYVCRKCRRGSPDSSSERSARWKWRNLPSQSRSK